MAHDSFCNSLTTYRSTLVLMFQTCYECLDTCEGPRVERTPEESLILSPESWVPTISKLMFFFLIFPKLRIYSSTILPWSTVLPLWHPSRSSSNVTSWRCRSWLHLLPQHTHSELLSVFYVWMPFHWFFLLNSSVCPSFQDWRQQ